MPLHADQFNQLSGTISPTGSLSQVIDTEGWTVPGLLIVATTSTLTAGSIQFRVGVTPTALYPLNDAANVRVAVPFGAVAGMAYGLTVAQTIAPWRYVQVETTVAQTNGAKITIPVKLN